MHLTNLTAGWTGMFFGIISGAIIGLFFHNEHWFGGYASFRRRMLRLGHIAFFGLGFVNILYDFSINLRPIEIKLANIAGACLILSLSTMSLICFLTAWKNYFRHLFFIPVASASIGIILLLKGWL